MGRGGAGGGSVIDACTVRDKMRTQSTDLVMKLGAQYVVENRKGEAQCKACSMILTGSKPADVCDHFAWNHTDDVLQLLKKAG